LAETRGGDPQATKAAFQAGLADLQRGDAAGAAQRLRPLLAGDPDNADLLHVLGLALHKSAHSDEGVALMARAIARNPRQPDFLINLANIHRERGEPEAAEPLLRRAVALAPSYGKAWQVLASLLRQLEKLSEAVDCRRKAVALDPASAPLLVRLASALIDTRQVSEGLSIYRQALARDPGNLAAHSSLALSAHYLPGDKAELFALHKAAGAAITAKLPAPAPHGNGRDPARRLRIGYVSPDFHLHSVAFFLAPVFAAHDAAKVEVFAYSDVAKPDVVTAKLRAMIPNWRDVREMNDAALADAIRTDAIDILVDLAGHTAGNRLGVFARRPAPLQVSWLGYPDTTGLAAMDARLTDAIADPDGADAFAVEKLVRLPQGFLCYGASDEAPDVAPLPAGPDGAITFGSFNNLPKLSDETLDLWTQVLLAVPGSKLLLKARGLDDPGVRQGVVARFALAGVDQNRLRFAGRVRGYRGHMALYGDMDIALDSLPYNGTTTTCEALWMGVPTVTLAGDRHCARVGASLLTRVGLEDLVAQTPEAYVAVAARLAADRARLAELRAGMRARIQASPLMNPAEFTASLEEAYRALWREWCLKI
jgi:predicted O-linked N-acetylglucosamine transferase (SPINDLY family)